MTVNPIFDNFVNNLMATPDLHILGNPKHKIAVPPSSPTIDFFDGLGDRQIYAEIHAALVSKDKGALVKKSHQLSQRILRKLLYR
jgi:hypothetical protein